MTNPIATILDLSTGFGYGVLYNPVIGKKSKSQYPLIPRFRRPRQSRPSQK